MAIRAWSTGGKTMGAAFSLALCSLLLPWIDLGFASQNGFSAGGPYLLLAYAYPLWTLVAGRPTHKLIGGGCGLAAVVLSIVYIQQAKADFFGATVSLAGTGLYLFALASVVFTIGALANGPAPQARGEERFAPAD